MRLNLHSPIKFFCLLFLLIFLQQSANAANTPQAAQNGQTTIKSDPTSGVQPKPADLIIGRVVKVEGQGWLLHSDEKREKLTVGLALRQGDSITTAPQSLAELRFTDGSSVFVKASSQVNIDQFRWDEKNKTGNSILEFVKGAFRAISGLIGKEEPENYELKTPVGTIGVRGTDFGARLCENHTCVIQSGSNSITLSQGIYIGVLDGQIAFNSNNGVETLVDAGQAIYQKDAKSPVKPVQNLPDLIFSAQELKTYRSDVKVPYLDAFLLNRQGKPVRDGQGQCIRSINYRADHNVAECQ
jgi:hypothetical protein